MKKLKRTTEEVSAYFANCGCKLLGEYLGCIIPMEYQCSCGRISKISWNNFTKGKRCGYCHSTGRKKKYTLEEVKDIFKNHGCILLATEYHNNLENLDCICKCGRPWKTSINVILNQKHHCPKCGREKIQETIKDSKKANAEYRKLYFKFRKSLKRTLAAIKKEKNDYSHKLLGYTARELQQHIMNHPNWDRVKDTDWHLDHVFPVKAFVDHGIKDVKLINCLENLQPLSQRENNIKCDNYDVSEFKSWIESKGGCIERCL